MILWLIISIVLSVIVLKNINKRDSGTLLVLWCLWMVGSAVLWSNEAHGNWLSIPLKLMVGV